MFKRTIGFSNKFSVDITLKVDPVFEKSNVFFFGFPFNFNESYFEMSAIELGNMLKGYWIRLEISEDSLTITTDILGGFRIYYSKPSKDQMHISDDFQHMNNALSTVTKENVEIEYWEKHGFTTGRGTFYKEVLKLSPASSLIIDPKGIREILYFKDVVRKRNVQLHFEKIDQDLSDTISSLNGYDETIILLFSGGKDSCLLLQYLISHKISFKAIFIKMKPIPKIALQDLIRARSHAKEYGIVLEELEIELNKISEKDKLEIIANQPLDKHYSLLHYIGMKKIKEKYGDHVIILNGQSSDSILSFGPSENSLMSFFRRNMMYSSTSFLSRLGCLLLVFKTRKMFKLPVNNNERLIALFDEYKYTRVIEKDKSKEYLQYLKNYIEDKTKNLCSFQSKEMYAKIASFCQGSDNQVVVKSAMKNNLKVLMPFATPNIVYSTIAFKNEKEEIYNPKYALDYILRNKFEIYYKNRQKNINDSLIEEMEIDNKSVEEMSSLFQDYVSKRIIEDD